MYYSDLYLSNKKRFPLMLIVVAMTSLLGLMALFVMSGNVTPSKAAKLKVVKYQIVNLTPQEVGVFWETETAQESQVSYGGDSLTKFAFDERDVGTNKLKYKYHYVILRDLAENQKYNYRIVTSEGVFPSLKDTPLSFITPQKKNVRSNLKAAYGKVIQYNIDQPEENAFVLLSFNDHYYPSLTMTKSDGSFVIPLNYLISKNSNEIIIPDEKEIVDIEIFNETKAANLKAFISQISNLPVIRIGSGDRNLTEEGKVLAATSVDTQKTLQEISATKTKSSFLTIIYPKENAVVPAQKPLIKGTALPNREVIVSINSRPEYVFKTQSDKKGEWKIIPTSPLMAGEYILTVKTTDETNNLVEAKQNFVVAKGGEQVLGEATAEPTIIQPTSVIVPSPTTDINQYITPTASAPRTGFSNNWLVAYSLFFIIGGFFFLLLF